MRKLLLHGFLLAISSCMPAYYRPYRMSLDTIPPRARVGILSLSTIAGANLSVAYNRQSIVDTDLVSEWRTFSSGLKTRWTTTGTEVILLQKPFASLQPPVRHGGPLEHSVRFGPVEGIWDYAYDEAEIRKLAAEVKADLLIVPVVEVMNIPAGTVYFPSWMDSSKYCIGVPASSVSIWFLAFTASGELLFATPDFAGLQSSRSLNEAIHSGWQRCQSRPRETIDFTNFFHAVTILDEVLK